MTRGSLAEQLANNIEAWIRQEPVPEGTPLPERVVAERFRVSRSPVREAMKLLADRAVIAARPDGGYAVSAARRSSPDRKSVV